MTLSLRDPGDDLIQTTTVEASIMANSTMNLPGQMSLHTAQLWHPQDSDGRVVSSPALYPTALLAPLSSCFFFSLFCLVTQSLLFWPSAAMVLHGTKSISAALSWACDACAGMRILDCALRLKRSCPFFDNLPRDTHSSGM
jgi:hypothetical protein